MKLPETTGGYAVKTWLFTLLAAVLCFFLHMSVTMVLSIASTTVLGQSVSGEMQDGRTLVMETLNATDSAPEHRKIYIVDADGTQTVLEDKDVTDPEDTGEEITSAYPVKQPVKQNIRSETDPGLKSATNWVAQILMAILFLAFPYSNMWYLGDHDRNSVQFGHMADNPLRGVTIGLLADIPAALCWVVLLISRVGGIFPSYIKFYRWVSVCFWPYFNHFIPSAVQNTADVTVAAVFAMLPVLLLLPLVTGLGYFLGYREFSIRDRLVYTATGKRVKHRRRRR